MGSTFLWSQAQKPRLTLDDFFNAVSIDRVRLAPDGHSLVVAASRADWDKQVFRKDLFLYRDSAPGLTQLTQSGHDSEPQWSPDGKWVAFLSDRKLPSEPSDESDGKELDKEVEQLYLVSPNGGEAFAVTEGDEGVHSFAWSPDSATLYFATREPWSKAQKDAYKKEWKDVNQYRAAERGDVIYRIEVAQAIAQHAAEGTKPPSDNEIVGTPGAAAVSSSPVRVEQLALAPNGKKLAFITNPISQRQEDLPAYEIYLAELNGNGSQPATRLTNNNGIEENLRWSPDGNRIFFLVRTGSVEGAYQDVQGKVYSLDVQSKALQRWAKDFGGHISEYTLTRDGGLLAAACLGIHVQLYGQNNPAAKFTRLADLDGTYEAIATSSNSPRLAFVYSTLQKASEVYLAENAAGLKQAAPVTSFNHLFSERELPQGRPYQWKADDGSPVEGMLIYPPGKFGAKNLRMFTFIHGGPGDADGDHFEADWYQWAQLAASNDWLVFEPNYRGSSGYGDTFMLGIIPKLVSRPGKDILEGVDALVRDGIADPNQLVIGGYSYGGYMTNWLITQTNRFNAAVSGAGAVEHAANWGNDDTTFDDTYFLGGRPWEATPNYNDEGAIFHFGNVKTPTHIVGGADDIRVAVAENYLLDHALHSLGIPSTLLIFPGEGHGLTHNPWHGKIKVREELKWLEKYGAHAPASAPSGAGQ